MLGARVPCLSSWHLHLVVQPPCVFVSFLRATCFRTARTRCVLFLAALPSLAEFAFTKTKQNNRQHRVPFLCSCFCIGTVWMAAKLLRGGGGGDCGVRLLPKGWLDQCPYNSEPLHFPQERRREPVWDGLQFHLCSSFDSHCMFLTFHLCSLYTPVYIRTYAGSVLTVACVLHIGHLSLRPHGY